MMIPLGSILPMLTSTVLAQGFFLQVPPHTAFVQDPIGASMTSHRGPQCLEHIEHLALTRCADPLASFVPLSQTRDWYNSNDSPPSKGGIS